MMAAEPLPYDWPLQGTPRNQSIRPSALVCAISDALGGHSFNRSPVVADMIVNAASGREQSHRPLQVSTA